MERSPAPKFRHALLIVSVIERALNFGEMLCGRCGQRCFRSILEGRSKSLETGNESALVNSVLASGNTISLSHTSVLGVNRIEMTCGRLYLRLSRVWGQSHITVDNSNFYARLATTCRTITYERYFVTTQIITWFQKRHSCLKHFPFMKRLSFSS